MKMDQSSGLEIIEPHLEYCQEASEVWEGRVCKKVIREEYAGWLLNFANWEVFVTLTFREETPPDKAKHYFKKLVFELNRDLFGKHFKRYVGESYFSYAMAYEYQLRGVIHFHFLADKRLNFKLLHSIWNKWAGFAGTEIIKDKNRAVRYVVKYVVKGGDIEIHRSNWNGQPVSIPNWWVNNADNDREISV